MSAFLLRRGHAILVFLSPPQDGVLPVALVYRHGAHCVSGLQVLGLLVPHLALVLVLQKGLHPVLPVLLPHQLEAATLMGRQPAPEELLLVAASSVDLEVGRLAVPMGFHTHLATIAFETAAPLQTCGLSASSELRASLK